MSTYPFGGDARAGDGLPPVAAAYEPVSRAFLVAHARHRVALALDLGCGPGFSTALLAEVQRPERLVGIDAEPEHLEAARERVPGAELVLGDVTSAPLPSGADLIYARLLLAHVAAPVDVARRWQAQLAPGGLLLLEDLEDIDAPPGALRAYDDLSAAVV